MSSGEEMEIIVKNNENSNSDKEDIRDGRISIQKFFPFYNEEKSKNLQDLRKKVNLGELIRLSLQENVCEFKKIPDKSEINKQKELFKKVISKLEQDSRWLQEINKMILRIKEEIKVLEKIVSRSEFEDLSSIEKSLKEKKQLLEVIEYLIKKNIYMDLLLKAILVSYLDILSKGRINLFLEYFQHKKRFIKMLSYILRVGVPFALQKVPIL